MSIKEFLKDLWWDDRIMSVFTRDSWDRICDGYEKTRGDIGIKKYVCGLMFNQKKESIVLIRKNRPDDQFGRLNGIGGRINDGESVIDAMSREFHEEAGVFVPSQHWRLFFTARGDGYIVYFLRCFDENNYYYDNVMTMTDEAIIKRHIYSLHNEIITRDLVWLVHMALAENVTAEGVFHGK